jgi:hypothetical protein
MGFRYRKSVKLGGGLRLNLSKRGIGISAGVKGLRFGIGPSGARITAGIPGTGLYYEKRLGSNRRQHRASEIRRQELLALQQKRKEALEQARYEVELYENRIEIITSVHKECSEPIDWESIRASSPPFSFGEIGPNEAKALEKLNNYKPSWRDKLFERVEAKKAALQKEIEDAKQRDILEYQEWEKETKLAVRIIEGDLAAYMEAIKELAPFEDIQELGSTINFSTNNPHYMEVTVNVHSEDVIPKEVKSLTKTGKLSVKAMPKTRFYELYQDYVCSCVLRIARELFAILPISTVYIHANGEILNTSTGHLEEATILSVMIPKKTLERLNFDSIDCSDSMTNFVHNMKFKKTKGFDAVEKITPKTVF